MADKISVVDLTGGAPELNPDFRYLVRNAVDAGIHVIDRCNLTVLEEAGQEDLAYRPRTSLHGSSLEHSSRRKDQLLLNHSYRTGI